MTSTIIRPSAVYAQGGTINVTGAANAAAALDASDSSYDQFAGSVPAYVTCDVGDMTLAANHMIYGVRIRVRYDTGVGSTNFYADLLDSANHVKNLGHWTQQVNSPAWFTTGWSTKDANNQLWTQTNVNSLRMRLQDMGNGSTMPRVLEAYVEVMDYLKPSCTVTAPTGTGVDGQPTATWTRSLDSGMTQSKYEIKVFTDAQYGDGSFSPDTWIPYWTPGVVSSNALSRQLGVLGDDVYRVYVRIAQQNGQYEQWSDWSYTTYTLNRIPYTPVLQQPATGITLDTGAGFTTSWQYSHPDPNVPCYSWALRRKTDAGAYEYWRTSDSTWQATVQYNLGTATSVVWSAGIWTNGHTYAWSVLVSDDGTNYSAWATDNIVIANSAPVVNVTAPAGTVSTTTKPTVTWTYSDAESNPQEAVVVRVFTQAQYQAGGFSPESSDFAWEFSQQGYGEFSVTMDVDLDNGASYRAYVKAYSVNQWSVWDYSDFTISLEAPVAPVVTSTGFAANGLTILTLQGRDNLLTTNQADMETDMTGWVAGALSNTLQRVTDGTHGTYCGEWNCSGSGDTNITTPTGTSGIPVTPSAPFSARVDVKSTVTARSMRVAIAWYNSGGGLISRSTGGWIATTLNTWKSGASALLLTATSPGTAAYAALEVWATGAVLNDKFRLDKAMLCNGTITADIWGVGSWDFSQMLGYIEASDDGGVTWKKTRSGDFLIDTVQEDGQVWENDATPRVARQYRGRISGISPGTSVLVTSLASTGLSQTWQPTSVYLRFPDSLLSSTAVKVDAKMSQKRQIVSGAFYTKGGTNAIVASESRYRGRQWDMTCRAYSKTDEENLMNILLPGRVITLCDPVGEKINFKVTGEVNRELVHAYDTTLPRRWAWDVTVTCVEVDDVSA